MFRPALPPLSHHHPQPWQESWARLVTPLTLWICVSVIRRYGYYGNCEMVLGPSSSRLFEANSVFVKQIEVRDSDRKGVYLYGFSEKPELSLETNWSVSNYVVVGSYNSKGFNLWLNKGSKIHLRWQAQTSSLSRLQVSLVKGERGYETLLQTSTTSPVGQVLTEPLDGREAQYTIEEDDKYHVGMTNANPRSIIVAISFNVSSKVYDISTAKSICSTINGSCRLNLLFPNTQFVTVVTPNNGDLVEWNVKLSFVARVVTYIAILVIVVIILVLILKYIGTFDAESSEEEPQSREVTESHPLMPEKSIGFSYGTLGEDQLDYGTSSSSEDLYDGKICVICFDELRNCFFVPCGHCATCYDCALRITDGEKKVCPICRRLIHKVRKLIIPYNSAHSPREHS